MKKITVKLVAFMMIIGFALTPSLPVFAADGLSEGIESAKTSDNNTDLRAAIKTVTNVLLFIIGAVSVIMIIIGGLRYVTSNGDSGAITSAKNTILYAVIGIVVALLAFAIVNFVVAQF